ncbi:hypothetical protein ACP70R_012177 [Stipagrostis hirtigluma subsp. patula]
MSQSSWSKFFQGSARGWVASEEPSGLSLVQCTKCKLQYVIELTTKTEENFNRKFFKCPRLGINGCNFFMWLPEYVEHLKSIGWIRSSIEAYAELELVDNKDLNMEVLGIKKDMTMILTTSR